MWVNGTLVVDYDNICTSNTNAPAFEFIEINGTIAQSAYDCPAHYRLFDDLTFASSSDDVAKYMRDPEGVQLTFNGHKSAYSKINGVYAGSLDKILGVSNWP